jgi:alkylation response protein AidB-like acyl-CoA dehydrogenase
MSTALQSLGLSAAAYECALEYAKGRIQSPLITNPKGGSVPIIEHADVRRMLMSMKAQVEGMRVLFLKAQMLLDMSKYAQEPKERKKCGKIAEFMIPLCKAHCSDTAYFVCRDAVQVHGGYGFTKDYPAEQYLRDCKIGSIWEGTNFIQSLDVVGRKLRAEGSHFNSWMEEIEEFIMENTGDSDFGVETALLKEAAE